MNNNLPDIVSKFPKFRVRVNPNWTLPTDKSWKVLAYLEPLSAVLAVAPAISRANFIYRSGRIKPQVPEYGTPANVGGNQKILLHNTKTFYDFEPIDIVGSYILVEWDNGEPLPGNQVGPNWQLLWTGVVAAEGIELLGPDPAGVANQEFTAYGLESTLDKLTIGSAWIVDEEDVLLGEIGFAPPFNEEFVRGLSEIGNRNTVKVDNGRGGSSYFFGPSTDSPETENHVWSHLDIVEYLIVNFLPVDGPRWQLHDSTAAPVVDGGPPPPPSGLGAIITPRTDVEGLTVRQALDRLIDRRRGFGWVVRMFPDHDTGELRPTVYIYSVFANDLAFDGGFVGRNAEQTRYEVTGPAVAEVLHSTTTADRYGRIIVTGERLKICCSLSYEDFTLEPGWTTAEEDAYKLAAGGDVRALNDAVRAGDKFHHVYSKFIIPPDWDWTVGDGNGTSGARLNVNPAANDDGTVSVDRHGTSASPGDDPDDDDDESVDQTGTNVVQVPPPPIRPFGHHLLHFLPLKNEVAEESNGSPTKLLREFRPMFAIVPFRGTNFAGVYQYAHRISDERSPSASVRPLDSAFGVEVSFHPRHILANNHFVAADFSGTSTVNAKPTEHRPVFDYEDLIITACVETDQRLHVTQVIPGGDPNQVLRIQIPEAEFWFLMDNTVTDLTSDGYLIRNTNSDEGDSNGVLRDDSDILTTVANLAAAWYGEARAAVSFKLISIEANLLPPGSMILTLSNEWTDRDVNTVVTEKTYDFRAGTTMIRTGFAELDFNVRERSLNFR